MGKVSVIEEAKKVRLERVAKEISYKTIGKEGMNVMKRRGRPPKAEKEKKMNASMDDYLAGKKSEGEKVNEEEWESDEERSSDESDGTKKREEEAFEKRSKIKRTPDLKQRAARPIFERTRGGKNKDMAEGEVNEKSDRWEEYDKKDILAAVLERVEELMKAKWEEMIRIVREKSEKISKDAKEEIWKQLEQEMMTRMEEEMRRNKNEVVRELRDKIIYRREEYANKETYKNKYKYVKNNYNQGNVFHNSNKNKNRTEEIITEKINMRTETNRENTDENNNEIEIVSEGGEKENERETSEGTGGEETKETEENTQIENTESETTQQSNNKATINFGPQPMTEEEWKNEKDKRKKKESNVKMYGDIPMSWMNRFELTKGIESIIQEKIYIKGGTRKNNALIINCGSWREAKKILDKKKDMEELGFKVDYDMTEREKQVQWWLAEVAKEGRKEGIRMRERYQGMETDDDIMMWNEMEGRLEFFRKKTRRGDREASRKQ
ncbi:myb-like protein X [Aphidius gifuensis]|uniref:myb-like protein X n=1 Tax=Aphidius gifuensis TaxID=684658 RepID=UPI001CDC4B02|nr:myb-like protein X [Aphidius gifuensis]